MKPQKKKTKKKTKFEKVRLLVLLVCSDELEFVDVIRFLSYSFILTFFQALHCMNTLICIEIL